jgi:hypothetical protein
VRLTEAHRRRVLEAVTEAIGNFRPCAVCNTKKWTIDHSIVPLAAQDHLEGLDRASKILPCVALTCTRCGNTHLLNMITLGRKDLLDELKAAPQDALADTSASTA